MMRSTQMRCNSVSQFVISPPQVLATAAAAVFDHWRSTSYRACKSRVEAEADAREVALSAVFNHSERMPAGYCHQLVHVGGVAVDHHRNQSLCARCCTA